MRSATIVARETAISMAINGLISAGFFVATFGLHLSVQTDALGWDFLPQAFAVGLMGSLVPGLLTARRYGTGRGRRIVIRSLCVALIALAIGGGAALAASLAISPSSIAPAVALWVKTGFGILLACAVTPSAVRDALRGSAAVPVSGGLSSRRQAR